MSPIFIYPDLEINVQLIRILAVLDRLSFNRNGTPSLTLEKITVFDFLIQHPFILFSILKERGKKLAFSLTDIEINSINREYPNNASLFRSDEHKKLLQNLMIWRFTKINTSVSSQPIYEITDDGAIFFQEIDTPYAKRLEELATALINLQSETYKNLIALIKPFTYGK